MFKGLGNIAALVKQAQEIGGRMQQLTEQLKTQRASGSAGAGMVEIEVNGLGEVLRTKIDPSLVKQNDPELIEDLVTVAANQAITKARELHAAGLQSLSGGADMPGLQEMLSKLTSGEPLQ